MVHRFQRETNRVVVLNSFSVSCTRFLPITGKIEQGVQDIGETDTENSGTDNQIIFGVALSKRV